MRFATLHDQGGLRPGAVTGESFIPFAPGHIATMLDAVVEGLENVAATELDEGASQPLASTRLGPALPSPRNIICVGKNYPLHAEEEGAEVPPVPLLFGKHSSTVAGHGDAIEWDPRYATQVDYEAELAVVIGRSARRIPVESALDVVAAYTAANDVSARDLQFGDGQWLRGKSLEGFMPIGPVLVTPDEIGDPQSLALECRVNGEVRQSGNTSEMFYTVAEIISFCSQAFTLQPGDVILTGTPAGVGIFMDPPALLSDGDIVEVEIEKIGLLANRCVAPEIRS